MNRITHFEIYTNDPQAVQPFYQDVFGWQFSKFEGGPIEYWLVTTGDDKEPGMNGGMSRPHQRQSHGTNKPDAEESSTQTIEDLQQGGGKTCGSKDGVPQRRLLA